MRLRIIMLTLAALITLPAVKAMDFSQAYQLALQHDTKWLAAQKEAEATEQDRYISRANLLPNVSYNYRRSNNDSEGRVNRQGLSNTQRRSYDSYFSALVLRQPLFDLAALRQYHQADLTSKLAKWNLIQSKQQLSVRLLQAYLQVLLSQDEVRLGQAHLEALALESKRSAELFKYGEATKTDQLEVQSRYQLSQAELISSQNQYDTHMRQLETMIGQSLGELPIAGLSQTSFDEFKKQAFKDQAALLAWQELALRHNAELATTQGLYEVAQLQVKKLSAEHYPRLNAFAQKQISSSNTENTLGERYDTNSIGIELSLPIFSGGSTSASVRQARARAEQARYNWLDVKKSVANELRRQYLNLISSEQRILAYEHALSSAKAQLEATRYSVQGGERTNLDILNAQQQQFQMLKNLSKANYDFLQAWLGLRSQAGVLNQQDIELLSQCFSEYSLHFMNEQGNNL